MRFSFFALGLFLQFKTMAQSKLNYEWYNSSSQRTIKENAVEPTNRYFNFDSSNFISDFRLNYRNSANPSFQTTFRPRIIFEQDNYKYNYPTEYKSTNSFSLKTSEAFIESNLNSRMNLSFGLQNYQWGPAEIISPSNPFYHFSSNQKSSTYKLSGRFLFRSNYSPNKNFSLVFIAEPINNGESFWIYKQNFKPMAALKIEKSGNNSLNYFGFVGGSENDGIPFIGEYANYEYSPGITFYFDSKQSSGSANYAPQLNQVGLIDMVYTRNNKPQQLTVVGARWESDWDIRYEFISQSLGLTIAEQQLAFSSILSPNPKYIDNLNSLRQSGREFVGKYYSYLSLLKRDFFKRDQNWGLRYFHSHQDQSASIQSSFEAPMSNNLTLLFDFIFYLGRIDQEISALETRWIMLGVKASF